MSTNPSGFTSISGRFACEVYWGDCDPAGIIFYPTYFRWFDAATWALFASVGYHPKRMRAEGRSMPLVAADCQFVHPAAQGDRCEIRSTIERFGGKSFVVAHEVFKDDGAILSRGIRSATSSATFARTTTAITAVPSSSESCTSRSYPTTSRLVTMRPLGSAQ